MLTYTRTYIRSYILAYMLTCMTRMYNRTHMLTYTSSDIHHIFTHTYMCTYTYTYMHTYLHTYIRTYMLTHTYVRTYAFTCIHACTHTSVHAYIHGAHCNFTWHIHVQHSESMSHLWLRMTRVKNTLMRHAPCWHLAGADNSLTGSLPITGRWTASSTTRASWSRHTPWRQTGLSHSSRCVLLGCHAGRQVAGMCVCICPLL